MIKNNTADLISFLEKSVSPYHTTAEAIRLMDESGFTALEQNKPWKLEKGGNYYVKCFGTMLDAALENLEAAGREHFALEEIYKSSMDFASLDSMSERLSRKIVSYFDK